MPFEKGNTLGKGRPQGSKNRLPDRNELCDLLDMITADLVSNYDKLTTGQKIRIITSFSNLYQDSALQDLKNALSELKTGSITFDFQ